MKPTLRELFGKLEAQGSPDQIALFLEQEQIKAVPGNNRSCAIAAYVGRETGATSWTGVVRTVIFSEDGVDAKDIVDQAPHSDLITDFINNFDREMYPNLIKETA